MIHKSIIHREKELSIHVANSGEWALTICNIDTPEEFQYYNLNEIEDVEFLMERLNFVLKNLKELKDGEA